MPVPAPSAASVGHDTLITVKVHYDGTTRRLKMPFKDMKAEVFPQKLLQLLNVPSGADVIIERYSDSAASFVQLDSENAAVYKQLSRAARAKLRLVIGVTTINNNPLPSPVSQESSDSSTEQESPARNDYLDTVLSHPLPEVPSEESPNATPTGDDTAKSTSNLPVELSTTDTVAAPQPRYREFENNNDSPAVAHQSSAGSFCIDCNNCGQTVPNEHYHCSICDDGDYDLCLQCVASGISCPAEDHWLIKRSVKGGTVTNSITEKIAPQNSKPMEEVKPFEVAPVVAPESIAERSSSVTLLPVPDASTPAIAPVATPAPPPVPASVQCDERICNACLKEYEETKMVTCVDCKDYDLCVNCLLENAHGHHPGHSFSLVQDRQFTLRSSVMSRCRPGRNQYHAAVCDGCDKQITGVRHKCLGCPDWDYCSDCAPTAFLTHPGHRFAPIYGALSEPLLSVEVHSGIFCDGPLCKKQVSTCIVGPRYKCTVCHDTDFCAKCEALPTNTHNHTHPLIKFKTPVRHVSVSTVDEDILNGQGSILGDRIVQKSVSTQANAPSQHETIPTEESEEKAELGVVKEAPAPVREQVTTPTIDATSGYQAFFVNDVVADGTVMAPNKTFRQTWKLYNPGPLAWPAGTDVRFVGGDSMINVDTLHPSSLRSVASAMESNKLTAPLEPRQTADFTVLLRSPSREGSAMSYWRLKLPNGTPFGHRLWCDIRVQAGASEPESGPKPEEALLDNEKQSEEPTVKEECTTEETEQTESRMIFPTLDKESPSIHEETAAPRAVPSIAPSTAPSESNQTNELDYLTVTDTMSMNDDDDVDGFLTDEEYDVLDASDQEYLEAKQSQ